MIAWLNKKFGMGPGDRVLALASPVFRSFRSTMCSDCWRLEDRSQLRLLQDEVREPGALLELLLTTPVTVWNSVPAMLQQLIIFFSSHADDGKHSSLRLVLLSGDWIPLDLAPAVKTLFAGVAVIGMGGATEAAIWSNFFEIESIDPKWNSVPYGKPITKCGLLCAGPEFAVGPGGSAGKLCSSRAIVWRASTSISLG